MKPQINLLIKKAAPSFSRKLLLSALAVTFIAASAFANSEESNLKAASSLKNEFSNAKNIEWKITPAYTKASFTWNEQQLEVFYNETGETIAVSRNISEANLPLKAQQYLQKRYADHDITETIEYTDEKGEVCYYVSLQKKGNRQIFRVTTQGDLTIFRP